MQAGNFGARVETCVHRWNSILEKPQYALRAFQMIGPDLPTQLRINFFTESQQIADAKHIL
jgi:hypothetical protein